MTYKWRATRFWIICTLLEPTRLFTRIGNFSFHPSIRTLFSSRALIVIKGSSSRSKSIAIGPQLVAVWVPLLQLSLSLSLNLIWTITTPFAFTENFKNLPLKLKMSCRNWNQVCQRLRLFWLKWNNLLPRRRVMWKLLILLTSCYPWCVLTCHFGGHRVPTIKIQ